MGKLSWKASGPLPFLLLKAASGEATLQVVLVLKLQLKLQLKLHVFLLFCCRRRVCSCTCQVQLVEHGVQLSRVEPGFSWCSVASV